MPVIVVLPLSALSVVGGPMQEYEVQVVVVPLPVLSVIMEVAVIVVVEVTVIVVVEVAVIVVVVVVVTGHAHDSPLRPQPQRYPSAVSPQWRHQPLASLGRPCTLGSLPGYTPCSGSALTPSPTALPLEPPPP